ncbi:MAG: hypothetical protein AAB776_02980 [Patescibacteria group bacterium]
MIDSDRTITDKELDRILSEYTWIGVKEHRDQPELSWEERYRALEAHHVLETPILIEKVRSLARRVHELENK